MMAPRLDTTAQHFLAFQDINFDVSLLPLLNLILHRIKKTAESFTLVKTLLSFSSHYMLP